MTESNPSFSNTGGELQPPGYYTYPNGQTVYIPYPFVPGQTPYSTVGGKQVPANPGLLETNPSAPGTHTDNTSNNGGPPGGTAYNPVLGPNPGMGGMSTGELESLG